jgi:hypothetical protein
MPHVTVTAAKIESRARITIASILADDDSTAELPEVLLELANTVGKSLGRTL